MSTELAGDDELALAVALARELLHGSGALLVSVALDRAEPALIECPRLRAIVVRGADGERELAHDAAGSVDLPELPLMRQLPPLEADAQTGIVAGVLGGLEMLGRAVREIAGLLPGRSVVAAEYETTDPDVPIGLAGRDGEPVIVLLGELEFELDC
ncbi:hypothetical protein BH20ACT17_BH20ACT17_17590 [soil metagenome]|jgi:hypothetical protein